MTENFKEDFSFDLIALILAEHVDKESADLREPFMSNLLISSRQFSRLLTRNLLFLLKSPNLEESLPQQALLRKLPNSRLLNKHQLINNIQSCGC